jgi:hypothetical protein
MQKSAKSNLTASPAAKLPQAARPLIDQRGKEIRAPLFSRSSPNDPRSRIASMGGLQNQPPSWNHCCPPTASTYKSNSRFRLEESPRNVCIA